ncbi:MAG: hypothetical protein IJS59_04115, partial [Bacteroidaceae bacterium]|nr:hypothetical protein [Bacteroidaceae bacterium]
MKKIKLFLAAVAAMVTMGVNAQTWTGSGPAEGTFFLYNVGAGKFINVGDKSAGWGTNAYLTAEYGLDFIFEANGTNYYLNSRISNGGSSYYLNTALWCDQGATPWTFTKVDRTDINAYTISNGSSYIVANAAGTDIEYVALSGTERDQWQLIGSSDILANLQANTASGVNRTQATFFISAPDFGRNDTRVSSAWPYTYSGGNVTVAGPSGSSQKNYGCEFWNNTFDIHQDLTSLPNGIYEFEIHGMATNGTTYVYATTASGTTSKLFKHTSSNGANFQGVLDDIDSYSGNVTGLVQVTDGTLTIGVKRETNSSEDWTVIDQARLYYYGDYTFAQAYGADLQVLITTAQALVSAAPYAALASDLSSAISTAQGVMENGTTEEDFTTGQSNLQSAIDTYNAQLTLIADYLTLRAAVVAGRDDTSIYTDGGSYTDALNSVLSTQDAAAVSASSSDDVATCVSALKSAYITFVTSVTVNSGKYFDLTNVLITNPTVSENTTGWTIDGTPNTNYSWGVCNYGECEFYQQNFDFYQTLTLPKGTWEFGVTGFHREGNHSTYFYAGDDDQVLIPGVSSSVVDNMAGAKTYFDNGNGTVSLNFALEDVSNTLKIGIVNNDTETDKWTIFRNFTLKFYGSDIDYTIYQTAWDNAVTAANTATTTYSDVTVGTEYTALTNALDDAPTSTSKKADYLSKTSALTSATTAFNTAAPYYEALATEIVKAKALGIAAATADSYAATSESTAATALTSTQNLMVAEYTFVSTNYQYAVDIDPSNWTPSGDYGTMNS